MSYEAELTEAYHVVYDIKDAHSNGNDHSNHDIRYKAYEAASEIAALMTMLGFDPPVRYDGAGRPK